MEVAKQFLAGLVVIGLATTLILPGRQTTPVVKAFGSVINGGLKTAMGR